MNKKPVMWILIGGLSMFAGVVLGTVIEAQSRGRWVSELCFTNSCIQNRLNALDPERAAEAKLTTWREATYVWYRE